MKINPFDKFNKDWALVTAGDINHFNSMTISWGSMGTIWGKDVITIYVRPDRYTFEFLKQYDTFTVSFYDQQYRPALDIMGSKSGRDINKAEACNFEAVEVDGSISYKQAKETFVCKKIYCAQMKYEDVPEYGQKIYQNGIEPHYIIMGEVINHYE